MSKEQISRLQGLLERVQERASAPRTNGAGTGSSPTLMMTDSAAAPDTPPMNARSNARETEPPVTNDYDEGDVEVSSEVVEVDIDIDEPMAMESGAQPIAQPTMPPDELEEVIEEEAPNTTQPSQMSSDGEELTQTNMAAPANEIEEPTPSSSRRPIAGEEAAPSYEEESSPRHTPPPESGKQVAAPSAHPPSRKPSAPPPSLEGHTLVGGWREPGLGPQVGVATGIRVPAPGQSAVEIAAAQASGTRLTADVTKPEPVAAANVASFQGAAPVAKPTTLGELLDLTLGL